MHVGFDSQIFRMQQNGGISKYFVKLIEELLKSPEHPGITLVGGINDNEHLQLSGLRYHGMPFKSLTRKFINNRFYNYTDTYNKLLEQYFFSSSSLNVIHHTFYEPELFVNKKAKRVITIHDLIYEKYPGDFEDTSYVLHQKKTAIRRADHIICVSKNTQKDLIDIYGVEAAKTSVIYHGVDSSVPQTTPYFKEKYILFIGKRAGYKNFETLLHAFAASELKQQYKLISFGPGKFLDHEKNMIRLLGLENKVLHITGSDQLLENVIRFAEFMVYPSVYEGFGLPVLEAMANNCPVICHNATSLPEVAGDAVLMTDCSNPEKIKEAMELLAGDATLSGKLRQSGKLRADSFTWQLTAQKTLDVYRAIAPEARK